ncbi:MAG: NTP transferase domain-containing protein [Planctomycetales bacterium]|nr:NTP transferase domain-containing protein [Planctomycetales bacterium]
MTENSGMAAPEERPEIIRCFAVLPAAGHSRRMGCPKLLLPWPPINQIGPADSRVLANRTDRLSIFEKGETATDLDEDHRAIPVRPERIIDAVLSTWTHAPVDQMAIVVRNDDDELADACRRWPIHIVRPSVSPIDMKASVLVGAEFIEEHYRPDCCDALLVAPADTPGIASETILSVVNAWRGSGGRSVVVPTSEGRRGHPILLPWPYVKRIRELPADQGLDSLLEGASLLEVAQLHAELAGDIDTPEDYNKLI